MRSDIATTIKPGDTVYNCFMEPFRVYQKIIHTLDTYPSFDQIQFIVKDENEIEYHYSYKDLYLKDLEDEDDAEKSWVNWAKDNKDFFATFDHIETTKEIYKTAFYNGFEHKRKCSYEEMMQK